MPAIDSPVRASVNREIRACAAWTASVGRQDEFRALACHRPGVSVSALVVDWLVIAAAMWLALHTNFVGLIAAVIVIGNRQRALGNLLHDISHYSFLRVHRWNNLVGALCLTPPLLTSLRIYRHDHNAHHGYVGMPPNDPDFIHDEHDVASSWRHILLTNLLRKNLLLGSAFGGIGRMTAAELVGFAAWWITVGVGVSFFLGPWLFAQLCGVWWAARLTSFHFITVFREITDHVGLTPGTLKGFTRNVATRSPLRWFFHPHNNGYHLTHHLFPWAPYHSLPAIHRALRDWAEYDACHHCDGYFWGDHPVVACWARQCEAPANSSVVEASKAWSLKGVAPRSH